MSNYFVTPWAIAHQTPLFMGFPWQEYWSGLPFPSPEDLPDLGIEPGSPGLGADALTSEPPGKPGFTFRFMIYLFAFPSCTLDLHLAHLTPPQAYPLKVPLEQISW